MRDTPLGQWAEGMWNSGGSSLPRSAHKDPQVALDIRLEPLMDSEQTNIVQFTDSNLSHKLSVHLPQIKPNKNFKYDTKPTITSDFFGSCTHSCSSEVFVRKGEPVIRMTKVTRAERMFATFCRQESARQQTIVMQGEAAEKLLAVEHKYCLCN